MACGVTAARAWDGAGLEVTALGAVVVLAGGGGGAAVTFFLAQPAASMATAATAIIMLLSGWFMLFPLQVPFNALSAPSEILFLRYFSPRADSTTLKM